MSEGACNNGHTLKMATSSLKPGIFALLTNFCMHYGIVIIVQYDIIIIVLLFFYQAILQTLMRVQTVAN